MHYRFADCDFDTEHPTALQRAGQRVPLQRMVSRLLTYLLQHHGHLVSKDELAEQVWQGAIANETIESCIRNVRIAVGDNGRDQRVLKTHVGYGYEWIAPVEELPQTRAAHAEPPGLSPLPGLVPVLSPPGADANRHPVAPVQPSLVHLGEKKVVTLLCCGVHSTTAFGGRAELDVLHSQLRALYRLVRQAVEHYGGTLQPMTGNRFLVVFGAPLAQEDHAQRAVLAALELQQQLHTSNQARQTSPPEAQDVSMGVHTGEVALGGFEEDQALAAAVVGDPAVLAAVLQETAEPGTILSSAVTIRLIEGLVHIEPAQPLTLAGQSTPLRVYKVLQRIAQPDPGPLRPRSVRPFVGRRHELATLRQRFEHVAEGRGQVVGITGEPGMGKSRLLAEFRQWLQQRPVTYLQGHCWSYGWGTPYGPILAVVRQVCRVNETDPPEAIARQVHQVFEALGMVPADHAPYLLQVLGVPVEPERLAALPAEELKARIYTALWHLCGQLARRQPLVVAIEDVHWSDVTSEALLTSLVEHMAGVPVLLVVTYRPEYHPAWLDKSYATQVTLQPLTPRDSRRLLDEVLPMAAVSDTLVQRLLAQAEGNPFFVEELAQTVVEHGAGSSSLAVPNTIQAVLTARMDRLPPEAKRLLQIAAVIGKDVPVPLLEAVAELSAETLSKSLEHLQSAEFLYETQLVPTPVYTFKHVLTQEVAHQSLLPSTRQPYHQRSAQILAERFPETAAVHPELLAHHYTEAGLQEQAIPYWQQAGQRAVERSANSEAVSHFTRGIEMLKALPVTPERVQQELTLQLALGPPLMMLKSHTAPEVEQAYTRAYTLAMQLGDRHQRFEVLVGLHRFYLSQAQLRTAREIAEQCFAIAQDLNEPMFLQEALIIVGSTLYFLGDFVQAATHLEQGKALSTPGSHHMLLRSRATAPSVVCLSRVAWVLWRLGYPDRALAQSQEALALARQLSHSYSLAFALQYHALLHLWIRQAAIVQDLLETTVAFMEEHGFVYFWGAGVSRLGWVLVEQGAIEEGIQRIHEGLEADRTYGAKLGRHESLALLAQAYGKAGQTSTALRVLEEAMTLAHANAERHWEAELYRLKGELLLQMSTAGVAPDARVSSTSLAQAAEDCFQQALSLARQQSARSLELRAAMSLGRLWQGQGKQAAARQLLVAIYDWFTEGFETPDLQAAQALLAAWQ